MEEMYRHVNFEYDLVSAEAKHHEKCISSFLLVNGKDDTDRQLNENIRIVMKTWS